MKDDKFEVVPGGAVKDRLGRVMIKREVRRELVAKFLYCGMTQAEFCRREGLNATTFSGWLATCRAVGSDTSDTGRSPKDATDTGRTARSPTSGVPSSVFHELKVGVIPIGAPIVVIAGEVEARCADAATAAALIKALREIR